MDPKFNISGQDLGNQNLIGYRQACVENLNPIKYN